MPRAAELTPAVRPAHWHPFPPPLPNRHWLSSAYTQFAVPYFIYDIYAMFLCHWHKHQVKGHGGDDGAARAPGSTWAIARGYLHKEFLMVLHHAAMVLVCFPLSVVWRQGKGDFFLGCMLMAEVSTPFVCLGKILIQVASAAARKRMAGNGRRGIVRGSLPALSEAYLLAIHAALADSAPCTSVSPSVAGGSPVSSPSPVSATPHQPFPLLRPNLSSGQFPSDRQVGLSVTGVFHPTQAQGHSRVSPKFHD
ncbi:ceramide synthase isoform X5 [Callithrix jacchus]